MSAVAVVAPRPLAARSFWRRTLGGAGADATLRATGGAGLILIGVLLLVPGSAVFLPLVLTTLLFRGPASGLVPIGVEPMLMVYGQLHSPWLVAAIAAGASVYAEFVSQYLVRGVLDLPALDQARTGIVQSRIMRLFDRRPAVAIAITAFSPIPDALTRVLAASSRYPVGRYVVADAIGRFPKLYLPAALGTMLRPSPTVMWLVLGGSLAVAGVLVMWRWLYRSPSCRVPQPGA